MSQERLPVASTGETVRQAVRLLARHRPLLAGTVAVLLAGTAAGLFVPALLGAMVDAVVRADPLPALLWPAGGLLAATAVGVALDRWGAVLLARLTQGALSELRERVFATALAQPAATVERAGSGDLVSRVSGDAEAVNVAIGRVLPSCLSASFTIALTVVGMGLLDGWFVLAALLATPVQYGALRWFLSRSGPVYREGRAAEAERGQRLIETLGGATTVTSLRHGDRHLSEIARTSEHAIGYDLRAVRLRTIFFGRLNVAEFAGLAAVLVTGYWLVTTGRASLGEATAAALYFHNLFAPVGTLLSNVDELQGAAAGLARLFGVTALPVQREGHPEIPARYGQGVEVEGVSHSYVPGRPVLRGVSLALERGRRMAVVGASGAGKSTLAKLVAGVHPPQEGRVAVDGLAPAGLSSAERRDRVVLLSQEVHVFSGSVADDLRLFAPEAGEEEILRVLGLLGADWVGDLPDGIHTEVGAGGHRLSAAQAQHLALARLVLADPPVAVLDEATAEAGTVAADLLDRASETALAGRTSVVVAHRLSQAATADLVVVMEDGSVVERGTHEDLLAAGGRYATLWRAWSRGTPA
ncbi:ABC transporter ATP-binding protein [Streptosporangium saharense]|uniref:ABC transporter ATP-binding protein n=1 Tax=Streptosporangium saharense TaxID=1706840 RepID=UPI0034441EA1